MASSPLLRSASGGSGAAGPTSAMGPSWLARLRTLDVYRTVPKDLTEGTVAGAGVSVVASALILLLFCSELWAFLAVTVRHDMRVEHAPMPPKPAGFFGGAPVVEDGLMQINFNITFPRMACAITAVGVQDVLGSAIDVAQRVHKFRTTADGAMKLNEISGAPLSGDYGLPQEQLNEGCQLVGHVRVKKVPGNLHFSSNSHPDILQLFLAQQNGGVVPPGGKGIGGNLNTSHTIHEFYFGDSLALSEIPTAALAPLNGGTKWSLESEVTNGNEKSYEYFIKVIPTHYQRLRGPVIDTYQFVSNSNEILGRFRMPSVYFRYDVEPILAVFTEQRTSFAHFIVNCCAIIGGVFVVLGLINSGLVNAIKAIAKAGLTSAASKD